MGLAGARRAGDQRPRQPSNRQRAVILVSGWVRLPCRPPNVCRRTQRITPCDHGRDEGLWSLSGRGCRGGSGLRGGWGVPTPRGYEIEPLRAAYSRPEADSRSRQVRSPAATARCGPSTCGGRPWQDGVVPGRRSRTTTSAAARGRSSLTRRQRLYDATPDHVEKPKANVLVPGSPPRDWSKAACPAGAGTAQTPDRRAIPDGPGCGDYVRMVANAAGKKPPRRGFISYLNRHDDHGLLRDQSRRRHPSAQSPRRPASVEAIGTADLGTIVDELHTGRAAAPGQGRAFRQALNWGIDRQRRVTAGPRAAPDDDEPAGSTLTSTGNPRPPS